MIDDRLTNCPSRYWVIVEEEAPVLAVLFCTSVANWATLLAKFVNIWWFILIIKQISPELVFNRIVSDDKFILGWGIWKDSFLRYFGPIIISEHINFCIIWAFSSMRLVHCLYLSSTILRKRQSLTKIIDPAVFSNYHTSQLSKASKL